MRIGAKHDGLVSIDQSNVPKGGKYGDAEWFADSALRYGLRLCWSLYEQCYAIYTMRGQKFVFQCHCKDFAADFPIPLTRQYLAALVLTYEQFCRKSSLSISRAAHAVRKRLKEAQRAIVRQAHEDMRKDVERAVALRRGAEPNKMFLPKGEVKIWRP